MKSKVLQNKNTFTQKPTKQQTATYILFTFDILLFYLFILPNLTISLSYIILTILFTITTFGLIVSTFICSYIDPSDIIVKEYLSISNKASFKPKDHNYCLLCNSFCHQNSKHCKICGRCVKDFDHHCVWINNCIGQANYKYFLCMISFTFMQLIIFLAGGIIISMDSIHIKNLTVTIILWIVMLIGGILNVLDLCLLVLHIYLNMIGLTTYQFISMRKQQKRREELQQVQKKVESANSMNGKNLRGNKVYNTSIQILEMNVGNKQVSFEIKNDHSEISYQKKQEIISLNNKSAFNHSHQIQKSEHLSNQPSNQNQHTLQNQIQLLPVPKFKTNKLVPIQSIKSP